MEPEGAIKLAPGPGDAADEGRGRAAAVQLRKVSVVIPAYNEADTIAELIRRVQSVRVDGMDTEIIVVDDCSTDRTVEQLEPFGDQIHLLRHPRNLGKGAAVQTGFAAAGGDVFVIQDADLEYDPGDVPALLEPIRQGLADVVLGSRFILEKPQFFTRGGSPFFSHYLGNVLIIWLTNLLYGFRATDYEGCYKAFLPGVIRSTPVRARGFAFDNELICKLLRKRCRIVEVPIRYSPRLYHEGKKIRWQDGMHMLWTIVKWRIWPL